MILATRPDPWNPSLVGRRRHVTPPDGVDQPQILAGPPQTLDPPHPNAGKAGTQRE